MNKNIIYTLIAIFTIFLASCTSEPGAKDENNLPQARGAESEILVVMDSAKWQGKLGDEVRNTFAAAIPGLPQNEPMFALKYVSPLKFNGFFRYVKNIIFVTTLNNKTAEGRRLRSFFTDESLKMIQENKDIYRFTSKNEYARGQQVLHLFGQNEEQLINHLENNQEELRDLFLSIEKLRISQKIYSGKEATGIMKMLRNDHEFNLKIPAGYKLAKEEDDFIWIRNYTPQIDKNIVIYYRDYTSENVFEDQGIFDLRKEMSSTYLMDIEDTTIYMTTETLVPLHTEKVNFNGMYAVETRGLWRLSDSSLGGPFLSYVFVDENINRLYYLEGYVASPGKNKRQTIRELETILWTFKTLSQPKPKS